MIAHPDVQKRAQDELDTLGDSWMSTASQHRVRQRRVTIGTARTGLDAGPASVSTLPTSRCSSAWPRFSGLRSWNSWNARVMKMGRRCRSKYGNAGRCWNALVSLNFHLILVGPSFDFDRCVLTGLSRIGLSLPLGSPRLHHCLRRNSSY